MLHFFHRMRPTAPQTNPGGARGLLVLCLVLLVSSSGCRSLGSWGTRGVKTTDEDVVHARRLGQKAAEAMQKQQWAEAEQLLVRAVEAHPQDERIRQDYSEVLWQLEKQNNAIEQMKEASRLSGENATMSVQLGRMYLAKGELEMAARCAMDSISADPATADAWTLRGDVCNKAGYPAEAMEYYHRALVYDPQQIDTRLKIAAIHSRLKRPRRALAMLDSITERVPAGEEPHQILVMRGMALKQDHRYSDAAEVLQVACHKERPDAQLLFELADAQFRAGDVASAGHVAREALAKVPRHKQTLELLVAIERKNRRMAAGQDGQMPR